MFGSFNKVSLWPRDFARSNIVSHGAVNLLTAYGISGVTALRCGCFGTANIRVLHGIAVCLSDAGLNLGTRHAAALRPPRLVIRTGAADSAATGCE